MKAVQESFVLIESTAPLPLTLFRAEWTEAPGNPGNTDFLTIFDSGASGTSGTFPVRVVTDMQIIIITTLTLTIAARLSICRQWATEFTA